MLLRLCSNWLYIVLGPLALTAPLTSFLGFYGIPLLSAEVVFLFAILILTGLMVGLVMALGGNLIQALISSGIIVLFAFSEVERSLLYPPGIRFRYVLLLSILLVSLFLYFLREHRVRFLLIIFSVMWLAGWTTPNQDITQVSEKSNHLPDASLPPYIHIILDEHIGVEGIPPAFDRNNKFSLELKNKYIDQGFLVFGRAYSRFVDTVDSLSSSLNFQSSISSANNSIAIENIVGFRPVPVAGGSGVRAFRPNTLFKTLAKRGYIINAFSTNVFSYCDDGATTTIRFGKCVIYGHGLKHFHNEFMILHNFMRKMRLHTMYAAIARVFGLQEINLAAQPAPFQTVVSANEFIDFLGEGKRGNAYFIHLIIPHSAYVFDEKCSYRDDWNFFKKQEMDETYARYLKQIQCSHVIVDKIINKLNSNPETQDSTIVISGDHGSRIYSSANNVDFFLSEDYIQSYSTFFAVYSPSFSPGYDKRPFALDELFKVFSLKEPNLLELENKKEKFVYTQKAGTSTNRSPAYTRFTLPPFSNGSKVQSW